MGVPNVSQLRTPAKSRPSTKHDTFYNRMTDRIYYIGVHVDLNTLYRLWVYVIDNRPEVDLQKTYLYNKVIGHFRITLFFKTGGDFPYFYNFSLIQFNVPCVLITKYIQKSFDRITLLYLSLLF